MGLLDWESFAAAIPTVLGKLPTTLLMVLIAEVIGLTLGVLLALVRLRRIPVLRQLATVYVSFIRGTPILIQLMLVFYGLPVLVAAVSGVNIARTNALFFAILALGFNEAGFLSEIFRSSIASVPSGQSEAAWASGLTKAATFRRIVLPQAVRVALPALGVTLIGLVQGTSLAFMIGVLDVMGQAQSLGAATGRTLGPYLVVGLLYVAISLAIRVALGLTNQRMAAGRVLVAS